MNKGFDPNEINGLLTQIIFNPLSYIHPRRLRLSHKLNTPRQRAIVNQMLISSVPGALNRLKSTQNVRQLGLLHCWCFLPFISTLVGAQLFKQELAWQGRMLKFSATVRCFMSLPLQPPFMRNSFLSVDELSQEGGAMVGLSEKKDLLLQVQAAGLSRLLDWQQCAPAILLSRMRLLFPPELDQCFVDFRRPIQAAELMLILQAIEYAKNHPNCV